MQQKKSCICPFSLFEKGVQKGSRGEENCNRGEGGGDATTKGGKGI